MAICTVPFGTTEDGHAAHIYTITNESGAKLEVSDLGACIVGIHVPDQAGKLVDVALGFEKLSGYEHNPMDIGAIVGRNANRISNSRFELAGKVFELTPNDGPNNLHAGPDYWFERLWDARTDEVAGTVSFHLSSPDGDQGFPANVEATITYSFTDTNELVIDYDAEADAQTLLNLTNHCYFNLNGAGSGTITNHVLSIDADRYTCSTSELITTGEIADVAGSAMDFREPKAIGRDFGSADALIDKIGGYDHNFVLNGEGFRPVARLEGDTSGIVMEVSTDLPAVQLYTSNTLDAAGGKGGVHYGTHEGVCLETQYFPDAINKPAWPQPIFGPDNPFRSRTTFAFSTK